MPIQPSIYPVHHHLPSPPSAPSFAEVYEPDPLLTFLGLCFLAEDKIWTSVQHNHMELTHVRGASAEKPYSMVLDYKGSLEQLTAVIDGSEHCEQEVAYHCKRSRLLNTPGKDQAPSALGPPTQSGCRVMATPSNLGMSRRGGAC